MGCKAKLLVKFIAVDLKRKKILALNVTSKKVADGRMLQPLVEEASEKAKVTKTLGDGEYDTKSNFHYLAGKKIEPVIKIRKNASNKAGVCMPIKLVAQEYLHDPQAWKHHHSYGQRWMVESAFSSLKRTFGEYVTARKFRNMTKEMILKTSLYNLFIGLTVTP
ncbi:MAG: transposase [Candidatus Bathyarchaeia archaeon]|jgi:hypothetical protein